MIRELERDVPRAHIFLVGFSAGTQIVQRTLLHRYQSFQGFKQQQQNNSHNHHHHNTTTTINSKLSPMSSSSSAGNVKGCMSMCVNQDYVRARSNLESSLLGKLLSYLTAHSGKELLRQNKHFFENCHEKKELLTKVLSSKSLSELDPYLARLYGHDDEKKYYEAISCNNYNHLEIPALFVQPADDPLHMVSYCEV